MEATHHFTSSLITTITVDVLRTELYIVRTYILNAKRLTLVES